MKLWTLKILYILLFAFEKSNVKNIIFLLEKFQSLLTMAPKKRETIVIPTIKSEVDAKIVFPKDWFILEWWMNFHNLEEEGFPVKGLFDSVG